MLRVLITRQTRYPADPKALRRKIESVLSDYGVTQAEVSVALVGERKMRKLAQTYLGEKKEDFVHEVLSFPATAVDASLDKGRKVPFPDSGSETLLGDIVICYPEARKIAIKKNRMMDDVVQELAEHATLHLLGIHHE